jgi:hypothetical protein
MTLDETEQRHAKEKIHAVGTDKIYDLIPQRFDSKRIHAIFEIHTSSQ